MFTAVEQMFTVWQYSCVWLCVCGDTHTQTAVFIFFNVFSVKKQHDDKLQPQETGNTHYQSNRTRTCFCCSSSAQRSIFLLLYRGQNVRRAGLHPHREEHQSSPVLTEGPKHSDGPNAAWIISVHFMSLFKFVSFISYCCLLFLYICILLTF